MGRRPYTEEDRTNNRDLGQRLAKIFAARQLTQADVSRALGVRPSTVSEWLSGKKSLDITDAKRIREKWGATLDYLYCGDHSSLPLKLEQAVLNGKVLK